MRIADQMVKCVGFISRDENPLVYRGTVFAVDLPYGEGSTSRWSIPYIVTAKHVADALGTDFVIGFNGKDGKPIFTKCGEGNKWFFHPTEPDTVDVAVMPFASAHLEFYDFAGIPTDSFVTEARITEFGIGLGDEITNIGLFTPFYGATHLIPIVRTGNIAMMPRDPVPTQFGHIEAYLIEGRSIGGLSGSPVFCRSTVHMSGTSERGARNYISGLGPFHFLGLMHGHWDVSAQFRDIYALQGVNMGVAIVVPATKIMEVMQHPELIRLRDDAAERTNIPKYPTPDIAADGGVFTEQDFVSDLRKATRRVGTSEPDEETK